MGKVLPFPVRLPGPWPKPIMEEWQPLLERMTWIPDEDDGVVADYCAWRRVPEQTIWALLNTYTHVFVDAPLQ